MGPELFFTHALQDEALFWYRLSTLVESGFGAVGTFSVSSVSK